MADLHDMIGQMILVGPSGHMTDAALVRLLEDTRIGGVILFKRNCPDPERTRQLIDAIRRRTQIKPFVMIDQEGGRVMRILSDAYRLPSARDLANKRLEAVENEVYLVGRRMKELGINVNLAPVLDINTNPDNPVIGDRSFGDDPETVWSYAQAYWRGQNRAGLISCGKHFPGHGDTDVDSHLDLPVVNHSIEHLESLEMAPFRSAITAGFDMIMVAHVLYPALDPDYPSTLSEIIGNLWLRNTLGFTGVAIADDLEMKAISGRWPIRELALKLLNAGMDLLPVCHTYELAENLHRAIFRLVSDGVIEEKRIKTSFERIINLKRKYGIIEETD